MYKRASRAMLHAHRVDTINPSGGYIIGRDDDGDALMSVEAMPDRELADESERLRAENRRWLAEQQTARVLNDTRRVSGIGATLQTLQSRIAAVNAETKRRNIAKTTREDIEFKRLLRDEIGEARFMELALQARASVS